MCLLGSLLVTDCYYVVLLYMAVTFTYFMVSRRKSVFIYKEKNIYTYIAQNELAYFNPENKWRIYLAQRLLTIIFKVYKLNFSFFLDRNTWRHVIFWS